MKHLNNITNPLERRRVQLGYSQQDISILLGITQSQYSRIEKGNSDPIISVKAYHHHAWTWSFRFLKGLMF